MTAPLEAPQLILPWPPSINTYWRHTWKKGGGIGSGRVYITDQGQAFRELVGWECKAQKARKHGKARVRVVLNAYPPDRRRRDLDNVLKPLLDALQHAGLYDDDSQIDRLEIHRMFPSWKGGHVDVVVVEIEGDGDGKEKEAGAGRPVPGQGRRVAVAPEGAKRADPGR